MSIKRDHPAVVFADGVFRGENGKFNMMPQSIYYKKLKMPSLRTSRANAAHPCVFARYDSKASLESSIERVELKGYDLLMACLTLRFNSLPKDLFQRFEPIYYSFIPAEWDEEVINHALKIIGQWCKRHGYPFVVNFFPQHTSRPLFKEPPRLQIEVELFEFLRQLNSVTEAYCLYVAISEKHTGWLENEFIVISDGDGCCQVKLSDLKAAACTDMLSSKLELIHVQQDMNDDGEIEICASSVFDAALYELEQYIRSPARESQIVICKSCGRAFRLQPGQDRRTKYCHNPCTPQSHYKGKKRSREQLAAAPKEQ